MHKSWLLRANTLKTPSRSRPINKLGLARRLQQKLPDPLEGERGVLVHLDGFHEHIDGEVEVHEVHIPVAKAYGSTHRKEGKWRSIADSDSSPTLP